MPVSACLESVKVSAQYTRNHLPEVAAYSVAAAVVTGVSLNCFGTLRAFSDRPVLALTVASFAIPFLGIFGIPTAAILSLGVIRYDMQRKMMTKELKDQHTKLTQNNEELEKRAQSYKLVVASVQDLLKKQNDNSLDTLYTTTSKNTDKLEKVAEQEAEIAVRLRNMLEIIGKIINQIEQGGWSPYIIKASQIMQERRACDVRLKNLERQIEDGFEHAAQMNQRLDNSMQRIESLKKAQEQNNARGTNR
jgi:hypothetical protein